jgi:hypothetical protein
MNSRNMILSGALIALVMLVTTNIFFATFVSAVGVETGVTPNSGLSVFTIKKAALICDHGASAPPAQNPPEIGGCVDVYNPDRGISGTEVKDYRYNEYMFTGEQLAELVVARDLSGAQFLASTANLLVDSSSKVTCSQVDPATLTGGNCVLIPNPPNTIGGNCNPYAQPSTETQCAQWPTQCKWVPNTWYGHDVSSLLTILPPKMGVADKTGFDSTTDKIYGCLMTVTPDMVGNPVGDPSDVVVQVSDTSITTVTTDVQSWYFNPAISISVSFDAGTAITFPAAQAGQTVYSTNTLMIENTAKGGVDLAAYLAGNDLTDTSGTGLCPTSNVLNVSNLAYRCKVGTYMSEVYTPLQHLNTKEACEKLSDRQCMIDERSTCADDGRGFIFDDHHRSCFNDLLPDASKEETSILYNGHTAECWFQLTVPLPCIGTFSAANAVDVLVRAI